MTKTNILSSQALRQFLSAKMYDGEFAILNTTEISTLFNKDNPTKIRFYGLVFSKNGGGTVQIDHHSYPLQKGRIFFMNYDAYLHFELQDHADVQAIFFTKLFYNRIYTGNRKIKSDTALRGLPHFSDAKKSAFKHLAEVLASTYSEYIKNTILSREILCLQLKTMMLMYIRISGGENVTVAKTDRRMTFVDEFKTLVDQHFKERKRTSDYAALMHISANYLNAVVKDKLDIPAERYIQNRVVLEAERLLLNTDLSVTEIAYELGFSDKSHFGKYFKKIAGVSPNGFRER